MTLKLPDQDIEFQIARLELRPGDVLIARAAHIISTAAATRLRAYLERALPGTKVVVIDAELELSVATKSDAKRLQDGAK